MAWIIGSTWRTRALPELIICKKQFRDLGSDIRFPDRPDVPPLKEHNRNVRFRPDSHQLESLSGSSQYGQAFDDWGHHFTTNNSDHARHEVIAVLGTWNATPICRYFQPCS